MSEEITKKELYSVDTNTMPWKEFYVEQLKAGFPIKELFLDPDTAWAWRRSRTGLDSLIAGIITIVRMACTCSMEF